MYTHKYTLHLEWRQQPNNGVIYEWSFNTEHENTFVIFHFDWGLKKEEKEKEKKNSCSGFCSILIGLVQDITRNDEGTN